LATGLKDIADQLGLSVATVSKALSDAGDISAGTKDRVWAAAESLNYTPNLAARGLRSRRSRFCGVIVDNVSHEFGGLLVRGVQDELLRCGFQTLLINADRSPEEEAAGITTLLERSVDGLILADTWLHESDALPPEAARIPTVFINRRVKVSGANWVGPDDVYGGYQATEHLIGHGHRRVAYIGGLEGWVATDERRRGYELALGDHGVAVEPALIEQGDWYPESACAAALRLLDLPEPPTAVFVANDRMASGVLEAARQRRTPVPEGLAVVGYDGREFGRYLTPRLTTVALPLYQMGVSAAAMVVDQILRPRPEARTAAVRGHLVYRASCGRHSLTAEAPEDRRPVPRPAAGDGEPPRPAAVAP